MLGKQIHDLRIEKGVTQNELAEALSVVPQAVSRWEQGIANPNLDLIPRIADYFEISLDELFGRDINEKIPKVENKSPKDLRIIVREEIKMLLENASNNL